MTVRRLAISALFALAFAVPVAGCGDDDDEADAGTVETSSLSKAQFVQRADRRCTGERETAVAKYVAVSERASRKNPKGVFEGVSRRILAPSLARQADAIRALGAPQGDEEQIEALLTEMEQVSDALATDPPSNLQGYTAQVRPAARLAIRYGFTSCASGSLV